MRYLLLQVGSRYELMARRAEAAGTTALLSLHGTADTTIPPQGGESSDGWLYETLDRSVGVWASGVHGCATEPEATSPHPAVPGLDCVAYSKCSSRSTKITTCRYDGTHGNWPTQPQTDDFVWEFFASI